MSFVVTASGPSTWAKSTRDRLSAEQARPAGSAIIALGDGFLMQWRLDPDHTPDGAELVTALGEAIALGRGVPAR